jgi:pyridoxine 4-dehydrogenase
MKQTTNSAGFTLAGRSLTVNRMGYGATQLAGQDGDKRVWGPPRDIPGAIAVLNGRVTASITVYD